MSGFGRLVVGTLLAGVLVAGLLLPVGVGLGLASNKVTDTIQAVPEDDFNAPVPERSVITDANGKPITYVFDQNRESVESGDIADVMKLAVISIEDRRFYNHGGVDYFGTLRALLKTNAGTTQGGSTITQQYVKNYLFLVTAKTEGERQEAIAQTPIRKLREAKLALQLANKYSKDDILTRYLNLVAIGPSTYGVQAAAERYFSTTAHDLTLPQAALLAGMINNPNKFNPIRRPDDALKRRDLVLDSMAVAKVITPATAANAKKAPLGLKPQLPPNGCLDDSALNINTYGFYCQYTLDFLANNGIDGAKLSTGGYTIKTNLDPKAMADAKKAVNDQADPQANKRIANVLTVVQPGATTRRISALVSNRSWGLPNPGPDSGIVKGDTTQKLTNTFAPLGAGSTFKVFTAAASLNAGMGIYNDVEVPKEYRSPLVPAHPFTNPEDFPGSMQMQDALAQSPNTTFVELQDQVGLDKVVQMSVKLGLRGYTLPAGEITPQFAGAGTDYAAEVVRQKIASFSLGVTPVSPLELANVGATLASEGMWCPPTPVDSVTDAAGKITPLNLAQCEQAVPAGLANALVEGMQGDLAKPQGTAHAQAQKVNWTRLAGAKTGTTQDYKSSAFLGFTPQYAGAVVIWDYLPKPQSICARAIDSEGKTVEQLHSCPLSDAEDKKLGMAGGSVPAATWLQAMTALHKGLPEQPFGQPDPQYLTGSSKNTVPSVVGMNITQATQQVQARGFKVSTVANSRSGGAINTVVGQSPQPNFATVAGATVTLQVATGS
ncbi:transglycosylase domain-containing protein [Nakamurella aerolata]|nr:transglycosylase domain-containing protein [Nakamurella aerolata]